MSQGAVVNCLVRKTSNLRWLKGKKLKLICGEITDKKSLLGKFINVIKQNENIRYPIVFLNLFVSKITIGFLLLFPLLVLVGDLRSLNDSVRLRPAELLLDLFLSIGRK